MTKRTFHLLAGLATVGFAMSASAFEYDVGQPGDELRPKWSAADTEPGVWTLNVTNALDRAKADGQCTILLNTASWWCPYCKTLEAMVLGSSAWKKYVAETGCYLAMLDFPYRNPVPADQLWKSRYPELGTGWGFDCWMMFPEYLGQIGLTKEQGLDAIMDMYRMQRDLALESATQITISNWQHTAEFTYGKVGYPTFIVFGPDGKELGRTGFPWYKKENVTASEAQEYVIQAIDQIINGKCSLCEDPLSGTPPTSAAQVYAGWIGSEKEGLLGLVEFKTGKMSGKGSVCVSGSVTFGGRRKSLGATRVMTLEDGVDLARGNMSASVQFGEVGLAGSVVIDGKKYDILGGGRNVFSVRDAAAKSRAKDAFKGSWNLVLQPSDSVSPSPFARGYGTLNVTVAAKGKAKVTGRLGDGQSVSVSGQVIMGEDGRACLPVYKSLYAKKGGFGFAIWFRNGKIYSITDVAPWVAAGKDVFTANYVPKFTMSSGCGDVEPELELTIVGFDPDELVSGRPLAVDPSEDEVVVKKTAWQGEYTGFKATAAYKTGLLSGSLPFQTLTAKERVRKVTGKFYGAIMGGSGYGTVIVPDTGSWPVKIAVCGSCGE